MLKNNKKERCKTVETLREREREPEFINKRNSKKARILKLNLSTTMVVAGAIVFVIIAIIAVRMIVIAINSSSQKAMAEEETKGYTMVDSTELGEDGKPLQVPVPDGFTASQVPGETTVNEGFVIYEGEVDWSKIEDLDSYAEVATQTEETNTSSENSNLAENANDEDTDVDGTNTEGTSAGGAGEENSNIDAGSNTESNTDSNEIEESANSAENNTDGEEEQTEEKSADVSEETEQGVTQEENITNVEEGVAEIAENETNREEKSQVNRNEVTEINIGEQNEEKEEKEVTTMTEEENETIATLAEGEEPTTVFELQTSRNQYVWVPVKNVSRIYGVDSNGKLWGKLYTYARTTSSRSPYWSESNGVMNKPSKTTHREPDVTHYNTNYDVDGKLQGYRDGMQQYQMLSQEMEEDFYKMIESIKKYGGFYIGRYETGDLSEEEAVVKKMNTNINNQTWYTMYEKCKNLSGEKENIETGMIWGSLWDETLQWLLESGAQIQDGENGTRTITEADINTDSKSWGNYSNATFEYTNTSGGTSTKNATLRTRIPTGSAEYTKANNIYDLAGNVYDMTLEAFHTNYRTIRGGYYGLAGSSNPAKLRTTIDPTSNSNFSGCRSALYIK